MKHRMICGLILVGLLALVLEATGQVQKPSKITIPGAPKQIAALKPNITDVVLKYANGDFIALDVIGTNLGAFSPTKRLYIDGIQADATEVVGWTANKIESRQGSLLRDHEPSDLVGSYLPMVHP